MSKVSKAFKSARRSALHHMAASERANFRWGETTVTEIVTSRAAKAVHVVPFTQPAEALSGADWVWWWVDSSSAYGMLVQAKRVTIDGDAWSFDFEYRSPKSARDQRDILHSTAAELELLPVYALYLGTGIYRNWERCSKHHTGQGCRRCNRRAVSLMPEMLASTSMVNDSTSTYEVSVALEEMWTSSPDRPLLIPNVADSMKPELAEFFLTEQRGTRAVSRSMMDVVLRARAGQFDLATSGTVSLSDGSHDDLGPVFPELPDDTMHGGLPYFEHVLNPLRHVPPDYVLEIMHGDVGNHVMGSNMPQGIAGVVVVDLSEETDE